MERIGIEKVSNIPSSNLALAPLILHIAHEIKPSWILDVGPGRGKMGLLLAEYLGRIPDGPIERIDAVEAWEPYVTDVHRAIYDEVRVADIREFGRGFFDAYDLVLMVDIIEHLTKEDGLEVLSMISGSVIICTPRFEVENPTYPPTEEHKSLWEPADFMNTGRVEVFDVNAYETQGAVVVRLGPLP